MATTSAGYGYGQRDRADMRAYIEKSAGSIEHLLKQYGLPSTGAARGIAHDRNGTGFGHGTVRGEHTACLGSEEGLRSLRWPVGPI